MRRWMLCVGIMLAISMAASVAVADGGPALPADSAGPPSATATDAAMDIASMIPTHNIQRLIKGPPSHPLQCPLAPRAYPARRTGSMDLALASGWLSHNAPGMKTGQAPYGT